MQRLLLSFVRNASLVEALSEAGKLRLAADMAQVRAVHVTRRLMMELTEGLCIQCGRARQPSRNLRFCAHTKVELAIAQLQRGAGVRLSDLGEAYLALR